MTTTTTRKKKPTATRDDLREASLELSRAAAVLLRMAHGTTGRADDVDLATATAAMHFCNVARMMDGARGAAPHVATCYDMAERLANLSNCPAPLELELR